MFFNPHSRHRSYRGFSLVEIMIGVVVGMLGIVVIMQVFLVSEGQKRTTTGGADAQENGLMALFTLEQDIRMAGLGLVGTGCASVNTYDENATPKTDAKSMWPLIITQNSPAAGSDQVAIMYSASPFANIPTVLTGAMPDSSAILDVLNGDGFVQGDIIVISEPPKDCSRVEASQDGQRTGPTGATTWNLQHNSGGAFPFNPPGGANIFPRPAGCIDTGPRSTWTCGYTAGARVTNMGRMIDRSYFVQDANLMMRDNTRPIVLGTNPVALVNGIVAIRAQYGRDTITLPATAPDGFVDIYNNTATAPTSASTQAEIANRLTEVVSVRLAVVARSGQYEKTLVSPASIKLWPDSASSPTTTGPELSLAGTDDRNYRYKVYQTVIPLRNIVWNNTPP